MTFTSDTKKKPTLACCYCRKVFYEYNEPYLGSRSRGPILLQYMSDYGSGKIIQDPPDSVGIALLDLLYDLKHGTAFLTSSKPPGQRCYYDWDSYWGPVCSQSCTAKILELHLASYNPDQVLLFLLKATEILKLEDPANNDNKWSKAITNLIANNGTGNSR